MTPGVRWLAPSAAATAFVALAVARPYVAAVRPWQYVMGVLGLAALTWARAAGPGRRRIDWLAAALMALLLPTIVDHPAEIRSDGIHYYAFVRSALFDRDLDFSNDYALLGTDYRGPNVLPVGAPLLWSPLVSVVHFGREVGTLFGWPAPSGTEPSYAAAVCLATVLFGAAGLVLLLDAVRSRLGDVAAFWAVVVAWVGSPLRFYLGVLPSLAHGCEFFAAVLALRAFLALRQGEGSAVVKAFRAGLAFGLLFLVRSQDGLLLAVPALELAFGWWRAQGSARVAAARSLLMLLGGFALAALPQLVVWQAQFGIPFLVPHTKLHGGAFLRPEPELVGTLLSPRGGLFVTYPALLVAVFGLALLAGAKPTGGTETRPAFDRRYVVWMAPVCLAAWWLNASVFDWYQVRRFTGLVPFLVPGLWRVFVPLSRAGSLPLAVIAFLAWRYDDAIDARRNNPGDPVPVRVAWTEMSDRVVQDSYRGLEPFAPRAAVVLLASYAGASLLEGPVSYIDLGDETPFLRLPRPAVYLSDPEVEDGRRARFVSDRYARLFLPLSWRGAIFLRLEARALETREPQFLELEWNGQALGREPMAPEWREYGFPVPAEAVRWGTNELVLRFDRSPIYFRVRGHGPREIRPAALGTLTLNRAGPEVR